MEHQTVLFVNNGTSFAIEVDMTNGEKRFMRLTDGPAYTRQQWDQNHRLTTELELKFRKAVTRADIVNKVSARRTLHNLIEHRSHMSTAFSRFEAIILNNSRQYFTPINVSVLDEPQVKQEKIKQLREWEMFRLSVISDPKNPRNLMYPRKWEDCFCPAAYVSTGLASFFKHIKKKFGYEITDDLIGKLATAWAEHMPAPEVFSFEVVQGADIGVQYASGLGSGCMAVSAVVTRGWLDVYMKHPDQIKMVLISKDKRLIGRALLWHTDNGVLLDRVYPASEGTHIRATQEWAREQGYDHKVTNSYASPETILGKTYTITLENTEGIKHLPYMDSFRYSKAWYDGDEGENNLPIVLSTIQQEHFRFFATMTDGTTLYLTERAPADQKGTLGEKIWYTERTYNTAGYNRGRHPGYHEHAASLKNAIEREVV